MKCKICDKELRRISNTHLIKHGLTMKDYKEKYGEKIEDVELTISRSKKISESSIGRPKSKKHKESMEKYRASEEYKNHMRIQSQRMIDKNPMKNKETTLKVVETCRKNGQYINASIRMAERWQNDEYRKEQSEMKLGDKNPMKREEVMLKNICAHNRKKSGYELKFESLLNKENSNIIEYVGKNSLWVDKKNPDYIIKNTNLLIEITSNYMNRTVDTYDVCRINHYNKNGYVCMCIWMYNLPLYAKEESSLNLNNIIEHYIKTKTNMTYILKTGEVIQHG